MSDKTDTTDTTSTTQPQTNGASDATTPGSSPLTDGETRRVSKLNPVSQPYIPSFMRNRQPAASTDAATPTITATTTTPTSGSTTTAPTSETTAPSSAPQVVESPASSAPSADSKKEAEEEEKPVAIKTVVTNADEEKDAPKPSDDDDEDAPKAGEAGAEPEASEEGGEGDETAQSTSGAAQGTPEPEEEDEDSKIRLVPNAPYEGKRVYDPAFLLTFRSICKEKPEGLPDHLEDILTDSTKKRPLAGSGGGWSDRGGDRGGRGGWNQRGGGRGRGGRGGGGGGGGRGGKGPSKGPVEALPPPDPSAWAPSSKRADQDSSAALSKKVTLILNKVAPKYLDSLSEDLIAVVNGITELEDFRLVVTLVFDRALVQPDFSALYATLCHRLQRSLALSAALEGSAPGPAQPAQTPEKRNQNLFRRILLNKCQEEFENKAAVQKKLEELTAEDKTEEEMKLRKRMLGNVIFIGELFKLNMLTDKIMHGGVIQMLLPSTAKPTHLDLEALCKLFNTIGKQLDTKNKEMMDSYFKRLDTYRNDNSYPSRIKFTISDIIDLRANRWVDPAAGDAKRKPQPSGDGSSSPRTGSAASGARTAGGTAPRKTEPAKAAGEWEVVGGTKGRGQRDRPQEPQRRDVPKQQPQGKTGGGRSAGGAGGRSGGRGDTSNRGGPAGSARSNKAGPAGAPPQASGGRGGRSEGKKKDDASVGTLNPFSLLGGDEEPSSPAGGKRPQGRTGGKPTQELYVPGPRRAGAGAGAAGSRSAAHGTRRPADEEDEPVDGGDGGEGGEGGEDNEIKALIEEYLISDDEQEAAAVLKDMEAERHYSVVVVGIELAVTRKDGDRAKIAPLLAFLKSEGLLDSATIERGFTRVLKLLPEWQMEVTPYAPKYVGTIVGQAIAQGLLPLSFLSKVPEIDDDAVARNRALPLVANALDAFAVAKGEEEFKAQYTAAGIDLLPFVREADRSKEFVNKYLKETVKASPALLAVVAPEGSS